MLLACANVDLDFLVINGNTHTHLAGVAGG